MSHPVETAGLTATIVAAYVSKNPISPADLPGLIDTVRKSVEKMQTSEADQPSAPVPAVSVKKSIHPDYLICLEDGQKFKSLKRHLASLGMTPDDYRSKWGLPPEYPMVAPNYAARRSELAKQFGLGTKKGN